MGNLNKLPVEMREHIFSFLDDVSKYSVKKMLGFIALKPHGFEVYCAAYGYFNLLREFGISRDADKVKKIAKWKCDHEMMDWITSTQGNRCKLFPRHSHFSRKGVVRHNWMN